MSVATAPLPKWDYVRLTLLLRISFFFYIYGSNVNAQTVATPLDTIALFSFQGSSEYLVKWKGYSSK